MLKEDGRHRKSKASKNRDKTRKCKCPDCHEMTVYSESNIIRVGNKIAFITCDWCGKEIKLK
jgi:transcription elongation factor Elf1